LTLLKSKKMKRIFSFFLSLMNYSNAEKQKRERETNLFCCLNLSSSFLSFLLHFGIFINLNVC
jgi:hypothetical protein